MDDYVIASAAQSRSTVRVKKNHPPPLRPAVF